MTTEQTPAEQQLLPGVSYRTETRQRLVPHTVNGKTKMVEEDYEAMVPVPPRDWDQVVTTAVTIAAAVLVAIAVVWSVASIGDLLARAVVAPIAYLAAGAFAIAWVACMALEWLARYDADRAAGPRKAGTWALVLDMAVVATHGYVEEALYVGLAGAAVSAIAKKMWTVVMRHQSRPLPARTKAWLIQEEAEISARLALASQTRHLARIEGQAAVYAPAQALEAAPQDSDRDTPGQLSPTVLSAVRAIRTTVPGLSHEDVLDHLDTLGLDYDPDVVLVVLDNEDKGQDNQDSRSGGLLPSIAPAGQTVTDSIRTALSSGVQDKDKVVSYVRQIHGTGVPRSTIVRTFNRERSA
ncbi:protein transporter Sec31 [Streptomyces sp. NPDC056749]|uniref:protein transporter Sec31 n=1 Tax=Streptomyces sp. NPDC056749 TaxID=3345936 RepID=UPI0036B8F362